MTMDARIPDSVHRVRVRVVRKAPVAMRSDEIYACESLRWEEIVRS